MNTFEYIARAKSSLGITSDYALAAHLGITRSYMSRLSTGKEPMSNKIARQFAEIIGIPVGIAVLDAEIERAQRTQDEDAKRVWEEIQEGFHAPSRRANPGFRGAPARL